MDVDINLLVHILTVLLVYTTDMAIYKNRHSNVKIKKVGPTEI